VETPTLVCSELISDLEVLLHGAENVLQENGVKPGIFEIVRTFVRQ